MKSIVVLLILVCQCHCEENGCPNGWIRFRDTDRCYYVSDNVDTFANADKFCKDAKGQLAPPITCDAHIDFSELLTEQRRNCHIPHDCDEFWIGIHNSSNWQTTQGFPLEQHRQCQQWARDFPNPKEGECTFMNFRRSRVNRGVSRNTNCTRKFKYVCITCPNNFDYLPEIDECLYFNRAMVNWEVARANCAKMKKGAQLVTIKDSIKQEAVASYLQQHLNKLPPNSCISWRWTALGRLIWMGGQTTHPTVCRTPYYVWKPVGEPIVPFTYSNWSPGMPNCDTWYENCLAIVIALPQWQNNRWEDILCSHPVCYACEF